MFGTSDLTDQTASKVRDAIGALELKKSEQMPNKAFTASTLSFGLGKVKSRRLHLLLGRATHNCHFDCI